MISALRTICRRPALFVGANEQGTWSKKSNVWSAGCYVHLFRSTMKGARQGNRNCVKPSQLRLTSVLLFWISVLFTAETQRRTSLLYGILIGEAIIS